MEGRRERREGEGDRQTVGVNKSGSIMSCWEVRDRVWMCHVLRLYSREPSFMQVTLLNMERSAFISVTILTVNYIQNLHDFVSASRLSCGVFLRYLLFS